MALRILRVSLILSEFIMKKTSLARLGQLYHFRFIDFAPLVFFAFPSPPPPPSFWFRPVGLEPRSFVPVVLVPSSTAWLASLYMGSIATPASYGSLPVGLLPPAPLLSVFGS